MKKILLGIITAFVCIIFSNAAFAENFYIENYDVNLKVNEDKSVLVTENIQVQFTNPSHGIIRAIPYKNASISNVRVNNPYSMSYGNSELKIKIGDPDRYINGKQDYNIQYRYTIHDTNNEFYFNIIGTEWPVEINNASFIVDMPKDFDFEKAGLSIGQYGTVGFKDTAFYQKEGNSICGKITQPLPAYNGITLRIEVPEDYFTNVQTMDLMKRNTMIGIILLTLISFLLWFIFGKDEHVTPVVTFYPPKGINSLEAEMIYKESSSSDGLVALLIELAGKGYISIKDDTTINNFTITKRKEYDGDNQLEKRFLSNLFEKSVNSISTKVLQKSSNFYVQCQTLLSLCNLKENIYFERSLLKNLNKFIIFICITGILLLTLLAFGNYDIAQLLNNAGLLIFPIIAIVVILGSKFHPFLILWGFMFGGVPLLFLISEIGYNPQNIPTICTGIIGTIISYICLKQMAKKNKHGREIMSQLLGLKKFLEVAEKHRLESLVSENPSYFYDILPYAYILGVSDKWIEKFQSIMNKNPDWYSGSHFNAHRFHSFTSNMASATIPTTQNGGIKESSGSSHSSSGGGGFSGGGHGGGGGSSW